MTGRPRLRRPLRACAPLFIMGIGAAAATYRTGRTCHPCSSLSSEGECKQPHRLNRGVTTREPGSSVSTVHFKPGQRARRGCGTTSYRPALSEDGRHGRCQARACTTSRRHSLGTANILPPSRHITYQGRHPGYLPPLRGEVSRPVLAVVCPKSACGLGMRSTDTRIHVACGDCDARLRFDIFVSWGRCSLRLLHPFLHNSVTVNVLPTLFCSVCKLLYLLVTPCSTCWTALRLATAAAHWPGHHRMSTRLFAGTLSASRAWKKRHRYAPK